MFTPIPSRIHSDKKDHQRLVFNGFDLGYVSQLYFAFQDGVVVEAAPEEHETRIQASPGLQGLCTELQLVIFSQLEAPELLSLARTCNSFHALCIPLMYRDVNLRIGQRISRSLATEFALQPLQKFNNVISRREEFMSFLREIRIFNRFAAGFLRERNNAQRELVLQELFANLAKASSLQAFMYNSSIPFPIPQLIILPALQSLRTVHLTLESWFNYRSGEVFRLIESCPKFKFELTLSTVFLAPTGVHNLLQLLPLFPYITELSAVRWTQGYQFSAPAITTPIKLKKLVVNGGYGYEDTILALVDFSQLEELALTSTTTGAQTMLNRLVKRRELHKLKKLWIRWEDIEEIGERNTAELAEFLNSLKQLEELGLVRRAKGLWKLEEVLNLKLLKTLVVERPEDTVRMDMKEGMTIEELANLAQNARSVEMLGVNVECEVEDLPATLSKFSNLIAVRLRGLSHLKPEEMTILAQKIFMAASSVQGGRHKLKYVGFSGKIFRVSSGSGKVVSVKYVDSPEEIWKRAELRLWRDPMAVGEDVMAVEWFS